ncbi:alpha/beta hydrolase fold domain-containing protein [Staphylococcus xylosus]|uniref:alpha/beta hydrolase fold domain-containing protein n=1 Tax=Staphylococcus xylosus TaxID=1288 RepID=UPI000C31D142|nr:alpha/beta hydrolase [Staphylococcus xylosus]MCQ3816847.1 alpha/beta hydrolase [Staphylococcus xylosus]MCQ3819519.1 alpha/beta hydrolase [Staphylococcus xylosus]PKI06032.1 esterase [Staphylococcus xylosus]UBV36525.1 alpha/beta hydrolase [Staphylococcus xylosus]
MTLYVHEKKVSIKSKTFNLLAYFLGNKKAFESQNKIIKHIKTLNNNAEYHIPKPKKIKSSIKTETFDNMQVFILNDQETNNQKVIFYNHGGGWIHQPIMSHWLFLDKIAKQLNAKVIVPIYTKVPHGNYSDVYSKLIPLYKHVLDSMEDKDDITLMGDSAGGNISLALAHLLKENGIKSPNNIILLSAGVDSSLDNPLIKLYENKDKIIAKKGVQYIVKIWKSDKKYKDPIISPIEGKFDNNVTVSHFIGTNEILYPDAIELDKKLEKQNININTYIFPEMLHVFPIYPIKEGQIAFKKIIDIIHND